MRIAIAEVGLDPTIGYLHVCQPGRQAVYDLMQPHRPEVDREVLASVRSQAFTPRDLVIDARGVSATPGVGATGDTPQRDFGGRGAGVRWTPRCRV